MDLPVNVGTGIVRVKLRQMVLDAGDPITADAEPAYGKVSFTPSTALIRHVGDGLIIPTTPVVVYLDITGSATVELVATDDADLQPSGWSYRVDFDLDHMSLDSFTISVPTGSDNDLAELVP